jgi:hypothetical protein
MKITSIETNQWETGRIQLMLDDSTIVTVKLNEGESDRLKQIALDIFYSRQKAIANEIETAKPLMIELQPEPPIDLNDEVPF